MKNFKYALLFCIGLGVIQPIQTQEPLASRYDQTLIATIYKYLWNTEKSETLPSSTQEKAIIFDLDGVLCTTDKMKAFSEIGIDTTLYYIVTEMFSGSWKLPNQQEIFEVLQDAPALSTVKSYSGGLQMPAIMVDWQCNLQTLADIQATMKQQIKNSNKSQAAKNFLIQTIEMMTSPEKFINTRTTIPQGVALLHELKEKGYKLYVLSNWDPSSFALLQQKFPEIFTYKSSPMFDGIMTSGQVKILKPDQAIFEKCLHDFMINKSDAIFIDDTTENIQAAEQYGISTIHCNFHQFDLVRKKLITLLQNRSTT